MPSNVGVSGHIQFDVFACGAKTEGCLGMAERSLRTEQLAGFVDSPPAEPRVSPERELPATTAEQRAENRRWNEAAENIGRTAGRAVAKVREFPRQIEEVREEAREKLREIRAQSQQGGSGKLTQLKEQAGQRLNLLKNRANERVFLARNRAQRMTRENPMAIIAGAFATCFVLGVALRIWRSNRV